MAKIRIRNFSLEMKDGNKVEKDIAELREHFDWERVLVYFHDGRLQRWLKINGYREEADKVADLQEGETFVANLCGILGVDVPKEEAADADPEDIKNKSARLRRLRQYTTDEKILALVENVAFTQEEMEELIDEAAEEVVLCDAQFKIPRRERGIKYYGAGRAVAVIESETVVDFAARHIEFHKIVFDKKYQQIVDAAQKQEAQAKAEEERRQAEEKRRAEEEKRQKEEVAKRLQEEEERRHAQEMQNRQKMQQAQEYYERGDARCVQLFEELAADGDIDAMDALFGWYTEDDKGKDDAKAFCWGQKALDAGDLDFIGILGMFYEEGTGTQRDLQKAFDCYRRAAEQNDVWAMRNLARCYENGVGVDSDKKRAAEWYMRAAEAGDVFAMLRTGDDLQGSEQYAKAHEWYEKAAAAEDEEAKGWALDRLGMMYRNGLFGEGHEVTAVRYFEQADEAGCAMGTYHLAKCYENGWGVTADQNRAKKLWERAMELGGESMQQELQQETHQTEQRKISSAEVLAELLGVIMSGNLFGGKQLWRWDYPVDVSGFNFRPWSRSKMNKFVKKKGGKILAESLLDKDEKILGGIVLKRCGRRNMKKDPTTWNSLLTVGNLIPGMNLINAAVELGADTLFDSKTMIFTDMAVYFDGKCIPYTQIENVVENKPSENSTVEKIIEHVYEWNLTTVRIRIVGSNEPIDLRLMQFAGIDTAPVQLFLLAAMNFYAQIYGEDRKQELTSQEKHRLAKIKLATLRNDCILDYI